MRRTTTTVVEGGETHFTVEVVSGPPLSPWARYKERRATAKLLREVCKWTGGTTSMGWQIVAITRNGNQLTVELQHA